MSSPRRTPGRPVKKATAKKPTAKKPTAKKPTAKKAIEQGTGAAMDDAVFQRLRALCLALPDTKLTMTWGSPHFRVGDKIFCGFGAEDGKQVMGVKLGMSHARRLVKEARFWPAPYVGKHGWVSMDLGQRASWEEVEQLIHESYQLIAPKASLSKLR